MLLYELFTYNSIQIKEGGNLELPGGHLAQYIDLKVHDRTFMVRILKKLLLAINAAYQKEYNTLLWPTELLQSGKFLSGSSLHFFNTDIPDEQFLKVKPKVGDIDTQVDKEKASNLDTFLQKIKGQHIGNATFLGYERGNEQFSSLWELDDVPLKIQIDLEFVNYETGEPTPWAQFSHSSAWEDIQSGIKGVFHKYLIQSFATLTKQDFLLRKNVGRGKAKSEQDVPTNDNMISFAVSSKEGGGLRQKYEPVLDPDTNNPLIKDGLPVLRARPTEGYNQSLAGIFSSMFGKKITPAIWEKLSVKFWSFTGLLDVMKLLLDEDEKKRVVESFIGKLFNKGAQGIYKNDPDRDIAEKTVALNKMFEVLNINPPTDLNALIADYKTNYRMTESLLEAMPDYKRQGIKHIYNPGSSTEMKDLDFINMCNEIAKNGGTLDGIQINLKIDGGGIKFGKDTNGHPFMITSKVTEPMYSSDVGKFTKYGEEHGLNPEQMARARSYDNALTTIVNSDFIKSLPSDTIVQAEMLFNEMAQKSSAGYKFVNIDYDPTKLGIKMTLVPFSIKQYSTGNSLPNATEIKKKLMSYSNSTIKFVDNHLVQNGVDVGKIVDPIVKEESKLKNALALKKKDPVIYAKAKEILNVARKALSDAIINSPHIKGKNQLGKNIEGLVINMLNGQLAKVTSSEMQTKMAAKKAVLTNTRTKTAVVTAGSFVGHKGHEQLVNLVLTKAKEEGGDPYVYISSKVGPDDPIPPKVKLETWQKLYPSHADMFQLIVSPDGITNPSPVKKIEKELVLPVDSPYKKIILMIGDDRYEGFKKWMDTLEKRMKDPVALAKFGGTQDQVEFETIRTGRSAEEGGTGISFTQLRNILKDPNATEEQQLDFWCKGFDEKKLGRAWR